MKSSKETVSNDILPPNVDDPIWALCLNVEIFLRMFLVSRRYSLVQKTPRQDNSYCLRTPFTWAPTKKENEKFQLQHSTQRQKCYNFHHFWLFLQKHVALSLELIKKVTFKSLELKGIVSQDFLCLQMILMDRIKVPHVPLDVYLFLNFRFHIVF